MGASKVFILAATLLLLLVLTAQGSSFSFPRIPATSSCANVSPLGIDLSFTFGSLTIPGAQNFFRAGNGLNDSTALLCLNASSFTGVDALGSFSAQRYTWRDANAPRGSPRWETTARFYDEADVVVLGQAFPDGITQAGTNDPDAVISGYPSWGMAAANSSDPLSFVHFSGYMAGNYPQYGLWASGWRGIFLDGGIANSGVVSVYDPATGDAVAISPFSDFMSMSLEVRRRSPVATAHWGIMGNVSTVPSGFQCSFILTGRRGGGVNGAVRFWGETLRTWYGKGDQQASRARDVTLQRLGYSTDNGAYYYYFTGHHAATYQQLIGNVKAYADAAKLPYGHVQFDSWWYFRADGSDTSGVPLGGVTNWTAMPSIFPNGLPFVFTNVTKGWPVMAHNRYWALSNVYAANPVTPIGPSAYTGPTFEFEWGVEAGLPTSVAFWDNLFALNSDWGLAVYEQDWLCTTMDHMPILKADVAAGRTWLLQMGEGAYRHGISVQYCMSYPRHVLQSVEAPAVTQARASNDYQSQAQIFDATQWRIAESSLWVAALGICPSKDSFWTMPTSEFDPHYDPIFNVSEKRNRLESASATMSNGVVQISDRNGFTDRSLVLRSCMADGTILHPDFSASPSESCFASRAIGASNLSVPHAAAPCGAFHGAVHGTSSEHGGYGTFFYVMSVSLHAPFSLTLGDVCRSWGYASAHCASAVAEGGATWLAYEANTTQALRTVNLSTPLGLAVSDEYSFEYFTLAPVPAPVAATGSGYVLLGEQDKWIAAAAPRFTAVASSSDGALQVQFRGGDAETVTLLVGHVPSLAVLNVSCVIGASLTGTVTVHADGSWQCASD